MQRFCLNLTAILIFIALGSSAAAQPQPALWPTNGWQLSKPEEQGIDPSALADLIALGASQNLDSLLITRHGRIVLDAYYAPYSTELPHVVNSVTKAVTGTLAAVALKDGLLKSPDQRVMPFFADRNVMNDDDRKKAITLQHLLDMTSGLDWQEPFGDVPQSVIDMERSRNFIEFVLNRPMARMPGERFDYNSGGTHLLSAVIAKVAGMSTEDYAKSKLFGPLGITSWKWRRDPQGISIGGYGLSLHPHDMAKFGYLYLRGGVWDGQQLLPPEWVDKVNHATVDMHASFAPDWRYANLFWAYPARNFYWASGYHCQLVLVFPALDVVAVTTGRDECRVTRLTSSIIAAVRSDTALPPDRVGSAQLADAISAAATEKPSSRGVVSPVGSVVSGKAYEFPRNALGLKSLSLTFAGPDPHYDMELYPRNSSRPPEKISGPLGLDGYFRKGSDTPYGPLAVKGRWLDDHTFEVERLNIGASELARKWLLWFDGDRLQLRGRNSAGVDVAIDSVAGN